MGEIEEKWSKMEPQIPGREYEHLMAYLNNILCSNVILLLVLGYMGGIYPRTNNRITLLHKYCLTGCKKLTSQSHTENYFHLTDLTADLHVR